MTNNSTRKRRQKKLPNLLKRLVDIVGSTFGILTLLPLFMVIPILVKLDSRGPIIYRRRVVGRNDVPFDAFKFRTMVKDADKILERDPDLNKEFLERFKLKQDPRVTTVGFYLRKYSFDELPQLVNVLMGQMSLVGPRMMTAPELEQYGKGRDLVLSVKPGITGLWQVSGRQDVSPQRRIELDIAYVKNWSLWKDIAILFRTFWVIVRAEGAY